LYRAFRLMNFYESVSRIGTAVVNRLHRLNCHTYQIDKVEPVSGENLGFRIKASGNRNFTVVIKEEQQHADTDVKPAITQQPDQHTRQSTLSDTGDGCNRQDPDAPYSRRSNTVEHEGSC
jgi:hypothetical protein